MPVAQNVPTSLKIIRKHFFFQKESIFLRGVIKGSEKKLELRHLWQTSHSKTGNLKKKIFRRKITRKTKSMVKMFFF